MARKYEIGVAADTGGFEKAVRNGIVNPLEDAKDGFRDLERTADRADLERGLEKGGDAADDLGRELDDAADEYDKLERAAKAARLDREMEKAQRATKELDGDLQDTRRELDKLGYAAKDAAKKTSKIGDDGKKSFKVAGDATGEFKSEALSNFSEVASSFDGSFESMGELAQGTLGGIAGAIPGIGIAGGVAALGIGAITEELTKAQEKAAETKQSIIEDFLDVGDALDAEAVEARARDLLGAEDTRKEAELLADLLGVTLGQAALALAGDFESAGVTADAAWDAIDRAPGDVNLDTWQNLQTTLRATEEGFRAGEEVADAMADATRRKAAADRKAAEAAAAHAAEVGTLRDLLNKVPRNTRASVNLSVTGETTAKRAVDRVVNYANGRVATIEIRTRTGSLFAQ